MANANKWQPVPILIEDQPEQSTLDEPASRPRRGGVLPEPTTVSTPLAVYDRSYQLIKSGWIKGYEAVNADGHSVAAESEEAVKWCVIGSWKAAIHYEPELVPHDYMYKYMETLWNTANLNHMINMDHPNPPYLNDGHNTEHSLILRCYEKVIAHLMKHPESNVWYPRKKAK